MLRHLGLMENAAIIENSLLYTLNRVCARVILTIRAKQRSTLRSFADANINNFFFFFFLERSQNRSKKNCCPNMPVTPTVFKLEKNSYDGFQRNGK